MSYFIYILTNKTNKSLYIGVTNSLKTRVYQHKKGLIEVFAKRYKLKKLVYYEEYKNINEAIPREKQLKNWKREWKIELIKKNNPNFTDLSEMLN